MGRIARAIPGLGGAGAYVLSFAVPGLEDPMVGGIVRGLAFLTSPWLLATAAGLGALLAIRRAGTVRAGIYVAGTALGGFALERGLHALALRVSHAGHGRWLERIATEVDGSFPPGHIVAAVTLYGALAFVVFRISRSWKVRACAWASAVAVVTLAGAGSVHRGDLAPGVVAGGAAGAVWLVVASTAWLVWDRLGEHPGRRQARDRVVGLTLRWGIFVVSLGVALHVLLLALPGIRQSASTLRHANLGLVLLALVLEAGSVACLGQVYRKALKALGTTVPYREAQRVALGMFLVARVMPVGGAAAGVWGAKELRALGVDSARAVSSVALGGAMAMATLGAIVFAGAAASLTRGYISPAYAAGIGLVLLVLAAVGAVAWRAARSEAVRRRIFLLLERTLSHLHIKADVGMWRVAADNIAHSMTGKGATHALVRWSAANWLLDVGALWLLFFAFGRHVHLGVVVVGYGVANLVMALPLTPGGIGLVEAGLAGTYTAFGVPASVAVVVVLAYRLISFWLPVVAGIPAYLGLGRGSTVLTGSKTGNDA